jgi:succinate dehydrogenase / fumarate reductase iron-sulfur subunit
VAEGLEAYMRCENCIECNLCVSACPIAGTDPTSTSARRWPRPGAWSKSRAVWTLKPLLDWVDSQKRLLALPRGLRVQRGRARPGIFPGDKIMSLRRELTKRKFRRLFGR